MTPDPAPRFAVAAIRISSVKQGLQGDSPDDQKQQIERFAAARGITIKKYFIFMESASKEQQPVQEAIDYCTKSSNHISYFIIKSIDRFTRGGSYSYDHLKRQLVAHNVTLLDIYGIISSQEVNTLEHLDVEYDWSVYSPTKKAEILEAERAKDEMRDIMTRMIGAEIRYVRMGYRVRRAPFGYANEKVDSPHGKRVVLVPFEEEAYWIRKMYQYRLEGVLSDTDIVNALNKQGFKTRVFHRRNQTDRTKIIGKRGGNPLKIKQLWRYLSSPIYAGVNLEKWTNQHPIKGNFQGLVSIEEFNKANRGKIIIHQQAGKLVIQKERAPDYLVHKKMINPNFPYKKYVLCPECQKPLFGSASRGKSGKYYPAYHCHARGHYFRVPSPEFMDTIGKFVKQLRFSDEQISKLKQSALSLWHEHHSHMEKENARIDQKIADLRSQANLVAEKIRYLNSEISMRYVEKELIDIEAEITKLESAKKKSLPTDQVDMEKVMEIIGFYLEHLDNLLLNQSKPLRSAEYFSLLFQVPPTYDDLVFGTPKLVPFIELKDGVATPSIPIGDPMGNRTPVIGMRTRCPNR